MDFFLNLVTPLSEATGIPVVAAALISFLPGPVGSFHHPAVRAAPRGLCDTTSTRWDDVVYYSISPPAEWAMWVCIVYGP